MNGFSTTLLDVKNDELNNMLALLDMHTSAPAWPKSWGSDLAKFEYVTANLSTHFASEKQTDYDKYIKLQSDNLFRLILKTICEDLISFKDHLNDVIPLIFIT